MPTSNLNGVLRQLKKLLRGITFTAGLFALLILVEVLIAIPGPDDHFHNPGRAPVTLGKQLAAGERNRYAVHAAHPLIYVVMGDSTGAGEGGDYKLGIAMETARSLSTRGPVTMTNLAVSGAKINDVRREQLTAAEALKPDIVLLAVGANDGTHFTPRRRIRDGMEAILNGLYSANPRTKVLLTGSPDLGAAPRFAQPLRWLAGTQTERVNAVIVDIARGHGATFVPIADKTGPLFRADPGLYAADRFHPNNRGYATWFPVLNRALDDTLFR